MADSTLGWRFINPRMRDMYGVDPLAETAENVAAEYNISRSDQDAFAMRSQQRAAVAIAAGRLADEIVPITVPCAKGQPVIAQKDEPPRPETTVDGLAKLKGIVRVGGTVTAGNSTGLNDGAGALVIASEAAAKRYVLTPKARIVIAAAAGVPPRVMGIGPIPASRRALAKAGLEISAMDVVELNEAFAAQALAVLRGLGVPDDAPHVNPNGGAIALGHPLGASGARLVTTAMYQLRRTGGRYALCTMCIGVGQGIAVIIELV
jgi:acetyl-CoA acetyltransferase family protein